MNGTAARGLSAAEVAERVRSGRMNEPPRSQLRDYAQIVARNLFTLFNLMVLPAAIALFALEEYRGAIAVSAMAVINSAIGLVQELTAKRRLDKLALRIEAQARVVRDGQIEAIPAASVVADDYILIAAGEVVVADGPVLEARFLELDEALLTGESDPVRHHPGDHVLSGSYCVAGEGAYRAERVGGDAFANNIAGQARRYHFLASPLTRVINLLIHLLTYTAAALCIVHIVLYLVQGFPTTEMVQRVAATLTSMVPQGLVLTATVAFTLGAVRMSQRGAIVQRLNAVESMAAVDVVCLDKTGTLTTNQLRVDRAHSLAGASASDDEVRRRLRLFASASVDHQNRSILALRAALGDVPVEAIDQIPFKSQNRYSAVQLRDDGAQRVLVLGACEALRPYLDGPTEVWAPAASEMLSAGLRVLMFAEAASAAPLKAALEGLLLRPLALVALSDELRPEAGAVLEALAAQGIAFKVISGDHPATVRATVGQLRLPLAHEEIVTGDEFAQANDKAELVKRCSIFGRFSPHQKVEVVELLESQGHHVAMIGDGVNDILPIKKAHLGIAMGAGAQATKGVAGLVLENNNFALLPETLEEGRTIVRNVRRSAKLFLVKNVYSLILILALAAAPWLFGLAFPYLPQQVTLLNWLVIGIPAFIIALSRERSLAAARPAFLREVGWFAVRTGVVFAISGMGILSWSAQFGSGDALTQRTLLLSVLILSGVTAVFRALTDGEPARLIGDTRFRLLAILAIPAYAMMMYWPLAADFFELKPLSVVEWSWVIVAVAAAYGLSLLSDRYKVKKPV
jgi:cation-transporting ATPase E